MLCQFTVKNYKSIRDEMTFDMQAAAITEHEDRIIKDRDVVVRESLDRVKLETGRRSALFTREENDITLKGVFAKLKVSEDLSKTLALLSYLGIAYKENTVVKDVLDWFDEGIDFLNYGNPIQELRMAISTSEDVKHL